MKERTSWVYFGKAAPNQRPFSLCSQSHMLKLSPKLPLNPQAMHQSSTPDLSSNDYGQSPFSRNIAWLSSTIICYSIAFKVSNLCSDQDHQILAWDGWMPSMKYNRKVQTRKTFFSFHCNIPLPPPNFSTSTEPLTLLSLLSTILHTLFLQTPLQPTPS